MKKEKFYELLGEIDENYIEEAHLSVEKKTSPIWLKWSSIAVCICLIIFGTVVFFELWDNNQSVNYSNEYVLEYEGDKCYMSFLGERNDEEIDLLECRVFGITTFKSLEELKDTIINNKFTDSQLNIIRRDFVDKDTKKIQICNPNKLFQAVYPKKFEVTKFIWKGLTYAWILDSEESSLSMGYITKEGFDSLYKQEISEIGELATVTKTEKIDDRNSTVSYYTTVAGEFKRVCYKLEQGEKILYVAETYYLKGYTDYIKNNVSLDVPKYITILGEQNNEYFRVYFSGEEQRPSIDYLLEFGLREL